MEFSFLRLPQFVEDSEDYFNYLTQFGEALALKHYLRFESALTDELLDNPWHYAFFKETGAPYRAKLFRVGQTTFWIIYSIDEAVITLHRFWDSAREPGTHGVGA